MLRPGPARVDSLLTFDLCVEELSSPTHKACQTEVKAIRLFQQTTNLVHQGRHLFCHDCPAPLGGDITSSENWRFSR